MRVATLTDSTKHHALKAVPRDVSTGIEASPPPHNNRGLDQWVSSERAKATIPPNNLGGRKEAKIFWAYLHPAPIARIYLRGALDSTLMAPAFELGRSVQKVYI